jgi:phi13 family phage major tail protein
MSRNKVKYGFKNVHVAFMNDDTVPSYDAPIAVPGAVSFAPGPEGDKTTFYADDTKYFIITSNNGYAGDLVMANVPDDILAEMFGWEIDNNGMLVEVSDAQPKSFALMGEVKGDKKSRRFVYYNCQASRPTNEKNTKGESVEPTTDTMTMDVSPIVIGGKSIVKGDLELSDTNATAFNEFFDAVLLPEFGTISITAQPQNVSVTAGAITEYLSVVATHSTGGELGYQWYQNDPSVPGGSVAITGATSDEFAIPSTLTAGVYYYYVAVSANGAPSVTSDVATVTVS